MKAIKLTTKTTSWTTDINPKLTNNYISEHFLGNVVDVGRYPEEKMEVIFQVEFLYLASFTGTKVDSNDSIESFKDVRVFGEDEVQAELNLYINYEHLSNIEITQVEKV